MLKVAILDDYQNVSQQFVDLEKLAGKYEIKIFSEPFEDEADVIDKLSDFEALLVMRERTPITKNIIENLNVSKNSTQHPDSLGIGKLASCIISNKISINKINTQFDRQCFANS